MEPVLLFQVGTIRLLVWPQPIDGKLELLRDGSIILRAEQVASVTCGEHHLRHVCFQEYLGQRKR